MTRADGGARRARGFAALGVRAVRTRLELIGIEAQLELARVLRRLLVGAAACGLAGLGALAGLAGLVLVVPEAQRAAALGLAAVALLAAGLAAFAWLRRDARAARPLLATMVDVLKGDEHALAGPAP